MKTQIPVTLDQQRSDYGKKHFMAMPLAGTIVWSLIALVGATMDDYYGVWAIWIGCGSIFYLGTALAHFMGEGFFVKKPYKNQFDGLFMAGVVMSLLVFAIAMPVAAIDHTTVPMTVGILAGLMWIPFSWIIKSYIGWFHSIARTLSVVIAWYAFPQQRFVIIPAVIVVIYIITLFALHRRYQKIRPKEGLKAAS